MRALPAIFCFALLVTVREVQIDLNFLLSVGRIRAATALRLLRVCALLLSDFAPLGREHGLDEAGYAARQALPRLRLNLLTILLRDLLERRALHVLEK